MFENTESITKAVLAAVFLGEKGEEESLEELRELAKTAGAEVIGVFTQNRPSKDTATCIGSGRLEEIREFCIQNEADLIIFDCELTPRQVANIEKETDIRTIDRTMLILDIFAMRARTSEGKLQVELAQLRYMLPRLTGKGIELSRLGGGIGTRGPGETKLETDKRHIRRRIEALSEKLEQVEKHRELLRSRRKKDEIVTAAIVGYTNAGKSTLLNTLTQAGVLAEDMLFATLDATARALELPSGASVMLVDTVGFIRNLPHHLIKAFRSTLAEAAQADIIINVCDASSPVCLEQLEVTTDLLTELGAGNTPTITVLNKCDKNIIQAGLKGVRISAKTGEGLPALLDAIDDAMPVKRLRLNILLPFDKLGEAAPIRERGTIYEEEYTPDGLRLDFSAEMPIAAPLKKYEIV